MSFFHPGLFPPFISSFSLSLLGFHHPLLTSPLTRTIRLCDIRACRTYWFGHCKMLTLFALINKSTVCFQTMACLFFFEELKSHIMGIYCAWKLLAFYQDWTWVPAGNNFEKRMLSLWASRPWLSPWPYSDINNCQLKQFSKLIYKTCIIYKLLFTCPCAV